MPSLDFEKEKTVFREFYNQNKSLLEDAKNSFITLINSLIIHSDSIDISKIEGRIKDREECIKKFHLKYIKDLETKNEPYSIQDHITDLMGLRIVCLYEDDIDKIEKSLSDHFEVIEKTDKISTIEGTENSFGYKGLHLDLKLKGTRITLPEYSKFSGLRFEIQIRTIIQDSWSVLDHKIKYKKSIPTKLKRRINTLAALFELADREFLQIRTLTEDEIEKEDKDETVLDQQEENSNNGASLPSPSHYSKLHAFSFLKIVNHFFKDFNFEPHMVDGFTQEITNLSPNITRTKFNFYLKEHISNVKRYKAAFEIENPNHKLNPFTVIRHCLYLGDKKLFSSILTNVSRENFENWLNTLPCNERDAA